MAFYKPTSNLKNSILAYVKNIVSKQDVKDINTLLSPCCVPILTIDSDTSCFENSYTLFNNVTVTTTYKNTQVKLIFTFTQPSADTYSTALDVTTDENGVWSDSVPLYSWVGDDVVTITVSLWVEGSQVITTSAPVTLTDVQNCG